MRNCSLRWQLTATEQPRSSLPEQPSPSVVLADDHRFACSIFAPWPMAHDLAQVMPKLTASTTRARILTAVTASGSISLVMEEPIVGNGITILRGVASLVRPSRSLNDLK